MAEPIPQGTTIGRYIVERQLGAGGMGEVYLARDTQLDRPVALKLLPAEMAADRQRMNRFMQEAKTASSLNQPNILTVFEIGQTDSTHFIATEFIDGETLRQHMAHRRLSLREAIEIAVQVASALSAAHKAGIVHRDIKPENIMVRHDDGVVKVLDFGLAKLTERHPPTQVDKDAPTLVNTDPGVVMGTAAYMSPEQARGLDVDARTDIWSLGVVLYEMVAGRPPFEGQTGSDLISNILQKEPLALTLLSDEADKRLDEIVTKALTKDKEERYQTAKDLFIDLKRMKQHLDVEAEIERTVPPELRSTKGRHSGAYEAAATAHQSASRTATAEKARTTSSAEYIVTEIKRHKKGAILIAAFAALVIAASVLFVHFRSAHALTEKDTILLADFDNKTGDQVFDGTLKQALAVQLDQSPFLNIYSEDRVRDALKFMGRSPDERVTKDVAREICERQGLKALLAGSIASLGSHYVITLEAVNAQTGDAIAREQAEADGKERVLAALGSAATRLREKLGESLSSIQKFDAPVEQATTSSLEALKAFSLGNEQRAKGAYAEAIPLYKRATELDPNFALAYAHLATMYFNARQFDLSAQFSEKAFGLRDRASERERFYIEYSYYTDTVGDADKAVEVLEMWRRTYPRDHVPANNLAVQYELIGQYEKAIEAARDSVSLNPNSAAARVNVGTALMSSNRFDESKAIFEQALSQGLESPSMHHVLFLVAFMQGDDAGMQRQVEGVSGKPAEPLMLNYRAHAATISGRLREAREFDRRAADLAERQDQKELAAQIQSDLALTEAIFGDCRQANEDASFALTSSRGRYYVARAALVRAFCGGDPQPLAEELTRRFPKDTFVNTSYLPTIRALVEIRRDNPAQAIQSLEAARRYESGHIALFLPAYVRGLAYLRQKSGAEAEAEFQKILDHKGVVIGGVLTAGPQYPLAHLGLARAAALEGDTARARQAYEDFFALWKDADPDIPILQEAKQEYEKLK